MDYIPKYKIPVRILLADEESLLGIIFIRQEQRILDMLCEDKQFFPVSTKTGMYIINKSHVLKVEVLDKQFVLNNQENFPQDDSKFGYEIHAELTKRRMRRITGQAMLQRSSLADIAGS